MMYGYDYAGRPYYPPMQQAYGQQLPQMQQQAPAQPQQIRSGGIVSVSGEDEARRYPVAPGYTVTMRDETAPYLYEKTMGFSQLDQPIFRKARIVFEDDVPKEEKPEEAAAVYAELTQLEALRAAVASDIQSLQSRIDKETSEIRSLVAAMIKPEEGHKKPPRKKEADDE